MSFGAPSELSASKNEEHGGALIRRLRKIYDKTQTEVHELCPIVGFRTFQSWESGTSEPKMSDVTSFVKTAFGFSGLLEAMEFVRNVDNKTIRR